MSFSPTDYITVLTVRYPYDAVMTKRLKKATNGVIYKTDYDDALKFDVQKFGVNELADLCGVLLDLSGHPNKVAIRGLPISGRCNVYRRLHGDKAAFAADPDGHHWIFADFDAVDLPMFLDPDDDLEIILGYLVRLLPPAFHNASYYWQWIAVTDWTAAKRFALICSFGAARSTPTGNTRIGRSGSTATQGGRYSTPACFGRCSQTTQPRRSLKRAWMTRYQVDATASMLVT